jgi:two-component system, OmpR family, response regulator
MLQVLVVEDDEDTASSLAMLLRLYGYEVEVAADGSSALRAVQVSPPDVVLLDIGLPKMDGWAVARHIRKQTGWKRPLLVAISGYGAETDQRRSQEVGMDLHLVKPVAPETLVRVLARFESIVIDAGQVSSAAPYMQQSEVPTV